MKQRNQIEKYKMFDGYLVSDDERVSDLIEALLDKGIIWEYLSALLKQQVIKGGTPVLPSIPSPSIDSVKILEENKYIKEKLNDVLSQLDGLAGLMKSGNVSINSTSTTQPVNNSLPVQPPPVVKQAKRTPPPSNKGGKGGLARGAKRMASLSKQKTKK